MSLASLCRWPGQVVVGLLILAIRAYQVTLCPLLSLFGPVCRFEPTCSYYGRESIRKHGLIVGGAKTAWRIARCGPWTPLHTPDPP